MRTTSSSISNSDDGTPSAKWRRFVRLFGSVAAGLLALIVGTLAALDPYDTGRFALLDRGGLPEQGPRTAHASRGRDPAYDAVVIGNSHLQLVDPAELGQLTGASFVTLTTPGTGPVEQFALFDYFVRHRALPPKAVVIGVDVTWCGPEAEAPVPQPFPFWLYDPSPWRYLGGLLRDQSFDAALRRIRFLVGAGGPGVGRQDGFSDYERDAASRSVLAVADLGRRVPSTVPNDTGRFPQLERLAERLQRLPAGVAVALVRPPVHLSALPADGTHLARAEEGCRARTERIANERARTALIDWRAGRPENRDPANFLDRTHYRGTVARALTGEIAAALARIGLR